jgi:hypothetical protein
VFEDMPQYHEIEGLWLVACVTKAAANPDLGPGVSPFRGCGANLEAGNVVTVVSKRTQKDAPTAANVENLSAWRKSTGE